MVCPRWSVILLQLLFHCILRCKYQHIVLTIPYFVFTSYLLFVSTLELYKKEFQTNESHERYRSRWLEMFCLCHRTVMESQSFMWCCQTICRIAFESVNVLPFRNFYCNYCINRIIFQSNSRKSHRNIKLKESDEETAETVDSEASSSTKSRKKKQSDKQPENSKSNTESEENVFVVRISVLAN